MGFFNNAMIPPNAEYLELLRYLLVMVLSVVSPYIGIVFGATLISLFLNYRDQDEPNPHFTRLAHDLVNMVMPNRMVPFVLGALPLLALWLIYGQWLFDATPPSMKLFIPGALLIVLSFGPISTYRSMLSPQRRNSIISLLVGAAGLGALVLGTVLLATAIVRFYDPERWHLGQNPFRLMLSFNVIWNHATWMAASLGFTGVALLFFKFAWPGRKHIEDESYARFVKNVGAGVALPMLLGVPVIWFFALVTTPLVGLSPMVYWLSVAIAAVLFLIFVFAVHTVMGDRVRHASKAFYLFIIVFVLMAAVDQFTLVNATREHTAKLTTLAAEREALEALERDVAMQSNMVADPAVGERVFKEVCSTCHRMDEKLVGPPLNTVLLKYDAESLVAFLRSPSKVDPAYPPMPAPAIDLQEMKSVAAYLLGADPSIEGDLQRNDGH